MSTKLFVWLIGVMFTIEITDPGFDEGVGDALLRFAKCALLWPWILARYFRR